MRSRVLKLFGLVAALGLFLVIVRGLFLLGYEPPTSDAYVWGAFHVHTTLSDGIAPLEEVAREARKAGVGFVMLSDHGAPHPEAALIDETIEGVRFIGGSEVALPEGHLIVSDLDQVPGYKLPPYPPDAVEETSEWGGFSIVTYPEDPTHRWRYWEHDLRPQGLEIVNVTSYFRASSLGDKLRWAVFSIFNPHYYVSGFTSPEYALSRWDELLNRGPVFAYYAANAHGGFPLTEERYVPVPSYATAFHYAGLGVDPIHAAAPEQAVRRGEFFSLVRSAGEPERFELVAESAGESFPMGSQAPTGALVRATLEVERLSPVMVLKRNGRVVRRTDASEIRFQADEPGVYRIEVYLEDHPLLSPEAPWILSNPVFVGVDFPSVSRETLTCTAVDAFPLGAFRLEKDDASEGTLAFRGSGVSLDYYLARATPDEIDRWVALALREPLDLSSYRGIYLDASPSQTMRYWLEVRSGDRSHYASVKLEPGGVNRLAIPWDRFYAMFGGREPPPLSQIDALFLTVNTSNTRTGFSSRLTLHEIGGCR